jgi:hypothetical protein
MILSYDDEEYYSNQQTNEKLGSDSNKNLKNLEKGKIKELQEALYFIDSKKQNINIFTAGIEEENEQNFDDEIINKISKLKIKNNQIIKSVSLESDSSQRVETYLTRDMAIRINSPKKVIFFQKLILFENFFLHK